MPLTTGRQLNSAEPWAAAVLFAEPFIPAAASLDASAEDFWTLP
jgi:hypothetical protein